MGGTYQDLPNNFFTGPGAGIDIEGDYYSEVDNIVGSGPTLRNITLNNITTQNNHNLGISLVPGALAGTGNFGSILISGGQSINDGVAGGLGFFCSNELKLQTSGSITVNNFTIINPVYLGGIQISGWNTNAPQIKFNNCHLQMPSYTQLIQNSVKNDFDGDRKSDIFIKENDKNGGTIKIDYSYNGFGSWDYVGTQYGGSDAHLALADYDGDRRTDIGIKTDGGVWKVRLARDNFSKWDESYTEVQCGGSDAHPVPADYDGDGRADISVKVDNTGCWLIDFVNNGVSGWEKCITLGSEFNATAHPAPADYDGDGKADMGIKTDGGVWKVRLARDNFDHWDESYTENECGGSDAHPLPADYDGDGRADISVKIDDGRWLIDLVGNGVSGWETQAGICGSERGGYDCFAMPGDYDGDGKTDMCIRRDNGIWLIDYAKNTFYAGWEWSFDYGFSNSRSSVKSIIHEDTFSAIPEANNSDTESEILSIYDLNGRIIENINKKYDIKDLEKNINLLNGVYIAKIKQNNNIITKKIIINH